MKTGTTGPRWATLESEPPEPDGHGGARPGAGRPKSEKALKVEALDELLASFGLPDYLLPDTRDTREAHDRARLFHYLPDRLLHSVDETETYIAVPNGCFIGLDGRRSVQYLGELLAEARQRAIDDLTKRAALVPGAEPLVDMLGDTFYHAHRHLLQLHAGLQHIPYGVVRRVDSQDWHSRRQRPLLPLPRELLDLKTLERIPPDKARQLLVRDPGFVYPEPKDPGEGEWSKIWRDHYGHHILDRLACYLCHTSKDVDILVAVQSDWGKDTMFSVLKAATGSAELRTAATSLTAKGNEYGFIKEPLSRATFVGINSVDRAGRIDASWLDTITADHLDFGAKNIQMASHPRAGQPLLLGADWPDVDIEAQGVQSRLQWVYLDERKETLTSDEREALLSREGCAWLAHELVRRASELLQEASSSDQTVYQITTQRLLKDCDHKGDREAMFADLENTAAKYLKRAFVEDYRRGEPLAMVTSQRVADVLTDAKIPLPKTRAMRALIRSVFPKAEFVRRSGKAFWQHVAERGETGPRSPKNED